jgi:hypothetical protein
MRKFIKAISICGLWLLSAMAWTETAAPLSSYAVGETTQSFTVFDVTGAYKGKRICYVCEFQDEPNVIGFFQNTGEQTADFISQMNTLVQNNKDRHLKAVAVVVAGMDAQPWLEELSAAQHIEIPLVVLRKGPADLAVRLYRLNPEVDNVFLVNINRKVIANVAGIEPGKFSLVADAATQMLKDNNL